MNEPKRFCLLQLSLIALFIFQACSTQRVQVTTIDHVNEPPEEMTHNPFFEPSPLELEAPDFHNIRTEDYLPAFERGMEEQMEEISEIATRDEAPTFENTIEAMERSGETLRRVSRVFFNMTSAHTNEELQEIQAEMAPRLSAHSDNIWLNQELFERVDRLYQEQEELNLDSESERLLEEVHRDFVRAGARLNEEDREKIREINERLSTLTTEFQEKLLTMTRERSVWVEESETLDGLSENRIQAARETARDRGYSDGYLITITNTTRQPVLEQLHNRDLRERIWRASANRGLGEDDGIDTRPMVLEIVELRAERARLLGYDDWASYRLEPQTAGDTGRVTEMIEEMIPQVLTHSGREAERIAVLMEQDGVEDEIRPWDWQYYAERIRTNDYELDEEEVRAYFELNRVLEDGVFYAMYRLYGITFEEREDLPVYHEDVRVFNVYEENGDLLGLFYFDPFERDSKRGGAWKSSYVDQSRLLDQKPVVKNVLNIPPPADGEPALISFDQVTTMFHEVGHAVHGLFSDVTYPTLSGTSVPRDFVEFPSTFHEDWAIHPEVIRNYAFHYETGERISDILLDRVLEARMFNQGFDTQEYLAATVVDLEWHQLAPDEIPESVESFEEQALQTYDLHDEAIPPRYRSPYFAHIFAGGYSSSYYAYIWSEVMAADAFAYLVEGTGLSRESGTRFRESILSRGGSAEPLRLYIDFRGQEPDVEHLLRRRGLTGEEVE